MPDVQHNALSGAELHEPKGVASASSNETYVADGAGSGEWTEPEPKGLSGESAGKVYVSDGSDSGAWTAREYTLTGVITDVSTAETIYFAVPYAGEVTKITTVLEGPITGADANILLKDSSGNAMGGMVIANSGSAAGDVDSDDTLTDNDVVANDFVTVETDGGSTDAQRLFVTITLTRNS